MFGILIYSSIYVTLNKIETIDNTKTKPVLFMATKNDNN